MARHAWWKALSLLVVAGCAGESPAQRGTEASGPEHFLGATPYIDSEHPTLRRQVAELVEGTSSERERAVRIHDFVRDEVRFGWMPAFYEMKASEVLAARRGYCNTKSTLFVALLRAAGIPARQHFVDIRTGILDGLISPGTPYVDHLYTEVFLEGRWLRVDSYIVDSPLHAQALERLARENRMLGYGVHRHGVVTWDGTADAFSQFVNDGSVPDLTWRDHGIHEDVGAFYRDTREPWNRRTFFLQLVFPMAASAANERIDTLREGD